MWSGCAGAALTLHPARAIAATQARSDGILTGESEGEVSAEVSLSRRAIPR